MDATLPSRVYVRQHLTAYVRQHVQRELATKAVGETTAEDPHMELSIAVCINALGRQSQIVRTLPVNLALAVQHMRRVRWILAIGPHDADLFEWVIVKMEWALRLRYLCFYQSTRTRWHDALWKNDAHVVGMNLGGTVVTGGGQRD